MNRPIKWILSITFSLFLILFLFLGFIPTIVSSPWGNQIATRFLEKRLGGSLFIDSIDLNWMEGQKVSEVTFDNPEKGIEFRAKQITLDKTLWELLFSGFYFENLRISSPTLNISLIDEKPPKGKTVSKRKKRKKTFSFPLKGDIFIDQGIVRIEKEKVPPIEFSGVDAHFDIPQKDKIASFSISGKTMQKEKPGDFEVFYTPSKTPNLVANINHFPISGLDPFISAFDPSKKGLLTALLGKSLNLYSKGIFENNVFAFSLNAESSRLTANVDAQYADNQITLSKTARANWNITPEVLSYFPDLLNGKAHLSKPTMANIVIEKLTLPYTRNAFDFSSLSALFEVSLSDFNLLLGENSPPIALSSISLSAETPKLSENATMQLKGLAGLDKTWGNLFAKATVKDLFQKSLKDIYSEMHLELSGFPTKILDLFFQDHFSTILGPKLDTKANFVGTLKNSTLDFWLNSPLLQISQAVFDINNALILRKPISFKYLLKPSLVNTLAKTDAWILKTPSSLNGTLNALTYPLWGKKGDLIIDSQLQSAALIFSKLFGFGETELRNFNFLAKSEKANAVEFNGNSSLSFLNIDNPYVSPLGPNIHLSLDGEAKRTPKGIIELPRLNLGIKGKNIDTVMEGKISGENAFLETTKPISVKYTLTPKLFQALTQNQQIPMQLTASTPIELDIASFNLPLKTPSIDQMSLSLNAIANALPLKSSISNVTYTFNDSSLTFDLDSPSKKVNVDFSSKVTDPKSQVGEIVSQITSTNLELNKGFNFWEGDLNGKLTLNNFSTHFFDSWFNHALSLNTLLGPLLDLDLAFEKNPDQHFSKLDISSSNLNFSGDFFIEEGKYIKNKNPAVLKWNITPEAYATLGDFWVKTKNPPFRLTAPAKLRMNISSFTFPLSKTPFQNPIFKFLFPLPKWDIEEMLFRSNITLSNMHLAERGKETQITELENLNLKLKKTSPAKPFVFDLKGNVFAENQKGIIDASGEIQKESPTNDLSVECNAKIKNLPVIVLDAITKLGGIPFPPSALFGEKLNATFNTSMKNTTGTLEADIDASNCKAHLESLLVNGRMMLQKPLKASILFSQKLSDEVLTNMSISDISSRKPIELYISDRGFSFPFSPYDPSNVQIPNLLLNLDKISCRSAGAVEGLFKTKNRGKRISLWFAPMDMHIKNGIIDVERTEILYNKAYQVALWGNILLPKEYVNMVLGITAQTLNSAFGLRNIPSNYVLQVPVKGYFGNVKIHTEDVSSKIALLVARGSALTQGLGIWGNVLGTIMEGMTDDQSSVPPPKPPFPWQLETSMVEPSKKEVKPPKKCTSLKRSYKNIRKSLKER